MVSAFRVRDNLEPPLRLPAALAAPAALARALKTAGVGTAPRVNMFVTGDAPQRNDRGNTTHRQQNQRLDSSTASAKPSTAAR